MHISHSRNIHARMEINFEYNKVVLLKPVLNPFRTKYAEYYGLYQKKIGSY